MQLFRQNSKSISEHTFQIWGREKKIQRFSISYLPFFALSSCHDWTPSTDRKFIVFKSQLMELFQTCCRCAMPVLYSIKQVKGSLVRIQQECPHCTYTATWNSQPFMGDIPAGNLLMSSAILFSGTRCMHFLIIICLKKILIWE